MLRSVWAGSAAAALLSAAVAWADEPAGPWEIASPAQHCVILRALEGLPGGWIEAVALPGEGPQGPAPWLDAIEPIRVSEYWIGLECCPADAALRAQLKLPEGQGLVVRNVAPESPAAKAGLQQHDVLVKAAGKPLSTVGDLVDAVEAARDKKLSLEIVRAAKARKIDVAPAKRPEATAPVSGPDAPDLEALKNWYDHLKDGAGPPMQFRFFHPGTILPPGAPVLPPLPDDMTVVVTRRGAKPAQIAVTQGNKKWEVSEKELDKLPKDVCPHVERMLGRVCMAGPGDVDVDVLPPGHGAAPQRLVPMPNGEIDMQLHKQIERMNHQIEELRKAIDEMHGSDQGHEKPHR